MANLQVGVAGNGTVTVGAGASVHSPASNTLTLGTNGDERLRITSAGKVGINEDVPQSVLHVASTSNYSDIGLSNSTSGHTGSDGANIFLNNNLELALWNRESGPIRFATAGTERLRITSAGKISTGGLAAPTSDMHIWKSNAGGDVSLRVQNDTSTDSGTTASIYLTTSPTDDFNSFRIQTSRATGATQFGYGTVDTILIKSDGDVGIGTDNPAVKLDIVDSGSPNIALRGSSYPSIRYSALDGTTDAEIYYGIGANDLVVNNVNAGPISFKTTNTERLRILSGGGITFNGDTAAANALDDYEEGDWTFSFSSGTVNNVGTTSGRVCKYRKVGGIVHFWFDLFQTNSNMELAGNMTISGLPFTPESQFHSHMSIATYQSNGTAVLIKHYINSSPNIIIQGNGTVSNIRHLWGFGSYPVSN